MTRRVIIIDDDFETRIALRCVLEDAGYDVAEAEDGATALSMLCIGSAPSIVLVDLLMPGISGIEVLRRIAADTVLAARHGFVGMTAGDSGPQEQAAAYLSALGAPLVVKPFDLDRLLCEIATAGCRLNDA